VVMGWSVVVKDVSCGRGMCGADACDLFPATAGVATYLSFTINPPSTKSRIICRRKDRGSCGCSRRWLWCFIFGLFGGRPPSPLRSLYVRYFYYFDVVFCFYGGVVVVVALCGGS